MAPRSQLEIHTASLGRLVKEEASYHSELKEQTERIKKLEAQTGNDDENREYTLNQEVCSPDCYCSRSVGETFEVEMSMANLWQRMALQQTRNVLPSLKQKIEESIATLDGLLVRAGLLFLFLFV